MSHVYRVSVMHPNRLRETFLVVCINAEDAYDRVREHLKDRELPDSYIRELYDLGEVLPERSKI